jgi:hypothetical protein
MEKFCISMHLPGHHGMFGKDRGGSFSGGYVGGCGGHGHWSSDGFMKSGGAGNFASRDASDYYCPILMDQTTLEAYGFNCSQSSKYGIQYYE